MSNAARGSRFTRSLVLSLVACAAVLGVTTSPASALTWTNVTCAGGNECAQIGTPVAVCNCGLWKDSPGALTAPVEIEAAFLFVSSHYSDGAAANETASWRAPLPNALTGYDTLEVRGAVNDNSDLIVVLYDNLATNPYLNCQQNGASVVAVLNWNDLQDDSVFRVSTAAVPAAATVRGVCVIVTDNPDNVVPASRRSSAIADYIRLKNAVASVTLEEFQLAN